jgi:hypothetical protein
MRRSKLLEDHSRSRRVPDRQSVGWGSYGTLGRVYIRAVVRAAGSVIRFSATNLVNSYPSSEPPTNQAQL